MPVSHVPEQRVRSLK